MAHVYASNKLYECELGATLMTVIIKSDKKATVSMGNVNGIKGPQDWSMFFDFENELYATKQAGLLKQDYKLTDVVEASRQSLSGSPISISKDGVEKVVASTTEIRTALLKNGRFGLLAEDLNTNFFLNSSAPATQTIVMPASGVRIVASCEGSGSLTITGDFYGSPITITPESPKVMERLSAATACNLNITVSGSLNHAQIELATGMQTATSKVKTGATSATREREFVKVKKSIFDSIITNKSALTALIQTIDYNPVVNQAGISLCQRLTLVSGSNLKIMRESGIDSNLKLISRSYQYINSTPSNTLQTVAGLWTSQGRFIARNQACTLDGNTLRSAFNGVAENTLGINNPFPVDEIGFGYGYASPIGVNGLRGIVTKLVVYDRVLTQSEITDITKSWL